MIAVDWLIHRHLVTLDGLQRFVDTVHAHGVKQARRAMIFVRERVESPRETVVRLMIVLARLPEPEPNVPSVIGTSSWDGPIWSTSGFALSSSTTVSITMRAGLSVTTTSDGARGSRHSAGGSS